MKAFANAIDSKRPYGIEKEDQLIQLKRAYNYLSKCTWYRKVSSVKTLSLGRQIYYLKKAKADTQLQITFCNRSKKLVFRDVNEHVIDKTPIKNLTIEFLMGGNKKSLMSIKNKFQKARNCLI